MSVARSGLEIEHLILILHPLGYIDRLVKPLEKTSLEVFEFLSVSPNFGRSMNKQLLNGVGRSCVQNPFCLHFKKVAFGMNS